MNDIDSVSSDGGGVAGGDGGAAGVNGGGGVREIEIGQALRRPFAPPPSSRWDHMDCTLKMCCYSSKIAGLQNAKICLILMDKIVEPLCGLQSNFFCCLQAE